MTNGFFRVATCVPKVALADCATNAQSILRLVNTAQAQQVEVALFPEMSITGYTCADLFHSSTLLDDALSALAFLVKESETISTAFIVGLPISTGVALYNCAALIRKGTVQLTAKSYIPNYNEFYERRWWKPISPGDKIHLTLPSIGETTIWGSRVFNFNGVKLGIEICEDLWVTIPPSCALTMAGAEVIFNLSASDDLTGKYDYLRNLVVQHSARCLCGYVYSSAGWGESSTDLTFDGKGIIAENGHLLECSDRWQHDEQITMADIDIEAIRRDRLHTSTFADGASRYTADVTIEPMRDDKSRERTDLMRNVAPQPFVPSNPSEFASRCREITTIQTLGLARRLDAIGCKHLVVGISGGLDSTLALLIAVRAFDLLGISRKNIIAITMPGFGTTDRTHSNAVKLMEGLGVTIREIPISDAVNIHFKDIGHNPAIKDVTYENCQARERTQILMDVANQVNGIVLGTGDLSELALGWATYNGDHMSMYGVNAGIPKTLVKYLVNWEALQSSGNPIVSETLLDIINTPISPELIPADDNGQIKQKTEDLVGPYELHDFFLYYCLRYGFSPKRIYLLARKAFTADQYPDDTIKHCLRIFYRRFFTQQFKRSCMPDGPKVGSVCLSPRGDWRMPSDASSRAWLNEIDSL